VLLQNDYLLFIYAHDIMIWITRSSDLHSDNIITTTTTTTTKTLQCISMFRKTSRFSYGS